MTKAQAKKWCIKCGRCCNTLYLADCIIISLHTKTIMLNKKCKFLTNKNDCSIYKSRPLMCKEWKCGVFYNKGIYG